MQIVLYLKDARKLYCAGGGRQDGIAHNPKVQFGATVSIFGSPDVAKRCILLTFMKVEDI